MVNVPPAPARNAECDRLAAQVNVLQGQLAEVLLTLKQTTSCKCEPVATVTPEPKQEPETMTDNPTPKPNPETTKPPTTLDYNQLASEVAKRLPGINVVYQGGKQPKPGTTIRLGETLHIPPVRLQIQDGAETYSQEVPLGNWSAIELLR
jgi:hypothetical protein